MNVMLTWPQRQDIPRARFYQLPLMWRETGKAYG